MNKNTRFKQMWNKANNHVEKNELTEADEAFDWCLLLLAKATLNGETHYCGNRIDLWKMRVWNAIEEAGLLPE
jgi:hypothetical protein